jgi:hypothetical protein
MTTATLEPRTTGFLPALGDALDAVDRLAVESVARLSDEELGQAMAGTAQLEAQVSARRHALLAEAERRRVADRTADTGTDAWAARLTGDTREVMRGGMLLAQDLAERFHSTRDAFASGRINLAQVRVIVHAARQSPPGATPGQVADAEQWLVDQATGAGTRSGRGLDAKRLRQAARRMFGRIDTELAIRHEAILLGRESRHAEVMTHLQLSDNGDGSWSGRFTIPELHGHLFKQALERLTSPRRLSRDASGRQVVDPAVRTGNVDELRGQALCELLEHLPTDGHAANGVTMLVTMELERLLDGLGSARLDTGVAISAGDARRLSCNAGLVPVVLDGASRPLDLGRTKRLHTDAQRKALAAVYDTCGIDGCERPFSWCEIHHLTPWEDGGATDLDNALPVCGHHHRRAHDDRFDLRRQPGGGWRFHPRR